MTAKIVSVAVAVGGNLGATQHARDTVIARHVQNTIGVATEQDWLAANLARAGVTVPFKRWKF